MPTVKTEIYKDGQLVGIEEREVSAEIFNAPILTRLQELDAKSIRALREGNTERLQALEAQAQALREQLAVDA